MAPFGVPELSEHTAERLFPDVAQGDLTLERSRSLVLARLLEDGDRADLAWLFGALPEREIAAWLVEQGDRKLSCRSACYWRSVLRVAQEAPADAAVKRADLWPL